MPTANSPLDFEIPGYDIIEAIGRGGMASVYRARQHTFDRNVALKILKPDLSEDDAFCQRFVMESLIVAKLNHSNIVQVYDVGEVANHYFIAMEFLSGGDLHKKLKLGLPEQEAVSIIKQIASALDFAHRKHIIHRDLKPDNVMFREDGAAVLTDFGIAKETSADVHLTQTGLIVGTPKYMSPEQIRGAEPSPQGDIYSLGIMFFQLLCNRVPFSGPDLMSTAYQHFNEPVPLLPPAYAKYQSLIEHMLAKNIEERMATGKAVIKALDSIEKRFPYEEHGEETQLLHSPGPGDNGATVVKAAALETVLSPAAQPGKSAIASQPTLVKNKRSENDGDDATQVRVAAVPAADTPSPAAPASSTPTAMPSRANKPIVALATVATITTAAIAFLLFGKFREAPAPAAVPIAEVQELVDSQEARIEQLLRAAEDDVQALRLTSGDDNALGKYREILTLRSDEPRALAGIRTIASRYVTLAQTALENGDLDNAQQYLSNAEQLDPQLDTSRLREDVKVALRDKRNPLTASQQFRISALLELGRQYEAKGNIRSPKGENAVESYRTILQIDPEHAEAKRRLASLENSR